MTRKLSAKWTIDKKVDMDFHCSDEVFTELAKNIQREIDQGILFDLYKTSGWHGTSVSYQQLDEVKAWIEENKLGEVNWFDNKVAFEKSEDYEWFILRWG